MLTRERCSVDPKRSGLTPMVADASGRQRFAWGALIGLKNVSCP